MARFIARRLIGMIAVLFAISVLVFLIFNVIPNSDPAARIAGKNANPELIARVSADLGLDQPLPVQYLTMMKQIFTGQLTSYASSQNVGRADLEGAARDAVAVHRRGGLWMALAIWFGYLSAVHAGKFTDRALTILALVGISMPVFWLAAILLYFLSFKAQLFPTSSYVPLTEEPDPVGVPPDPAVDHAGGAVRRVLQPGAALQHARRDERRPRAHRARQGDQRAAGADPTCAAQLDDPDHHACSAWTSARSSAAARSSPRRCTTSTASASTPVRRSAASTCRR